MKILFQQDAIATLVKTHITPALKNFSIITFQGPLGAGKTTIIKELLKQCHIHDPITSPTFGYVNTYTNDQKLIFYHFDLYRIDTIETFFSLGFNEYLHKENSICIIEWPEIINSILEERNMAPHVFPIILGYNPTVFYQRYAILKKG